MSRKKITTLEYFWLTPLALALVAVLLFMFSLGDRRKEELNSQSLKNMEEIVQAQISLHSNILKSRVFYLNHFDGIVMDQKLLLKASSDLITVAKNRLAQDSSFDESLQDMRRQIMEQDSVIEDFKSSLSVYKNSEQYIGVVIAEFLAQRSPAVPQQFLIHFAQFSNQMSRFRSKPVTEQKLPLKLLLRRVEISAASFRQQDRVIFDQIVAHSHVIMNQAENIELALAQVLNGNLDRTVETVQNNLIREQVSIRATLKKYEQALYSIIVVLTFYTFFILIRLKFANDMLEQRVEERTQELGVATQKAVAADAAKSTFLAHMSHEIRTPLNGVIGITALLLKRDLPLPDKDMVQAISYCGKSLLALINDILDFSKIEANKLKLTRAPFRLSEVVDESLSIVSINASKESVTLLKELSRDLPAQIYGDKDRVSQVLLNLLSNAIKFSKNGQVLVKLTAERMTNQIFQIRLDVIDNGIGIEEPQLKNLFQEFSQANTAIQANFGGTGLGLAISKKLAELMGGRITVKSQFGVGSTFSFTFPAHLAEKSADARTETQSSPLLGTDHPHRILVIDDNFINRKVAGELLVSLGYKPDIAPSGAEALALLEGKDYDLVFTDLRMPLMDGYEFVRQAKALGKKAPSFVAMTASATLEEKERCQQSGIAYFISKPIQEADLIAILKEVAPDRS